MSVPGDQVDALTEVFKSSGKSTGLEVWRIEKFQLKQIRKSAFGTFYTGDCYVVLQTDIQNGCSRYNLHFWIGRKSSQDEYGAAAIISAQWDAFLGDVPVQYREVDGHEGQMFRSYFTGIRRLKGGVGSGFNHVEVNGDSNRRMLQIKGCSRSTEATEVDFAWSSITTDDCFVIEIGETIFGWQGKLANKDEVFKMGDMMNHILHNEQCGRGQKFFVTEGASIPRDENQMLVDALGNIPAVFPNSGIDPANKVAPSEELSVAASPELYKCSKDTGTLEITQIDGISRANLENDDVYILNCGEVGKVFVWIGDTALKSEKKIGMKKAQEFMLEKGLGQCVLVVFGQRYETNEFKAYFSDWTD